MADFISKKESDIESHGLVERERYKLMFHKDIFDCVLSINIFISYKCAGVSSSSQNGKGIPFLPDSASPPQARDLRGSGQPLAELGGSEKQARASIPWRIGTKRLALRRLEGEKRELVAGGFFAPHFAMSGSRETQDLFRGHKLHSSAPHCMRPFA